MESLIRKTLTESIKAKDSKKSLVLRSLISKIEESKKLPGFTEHTSESLNKILFNAIKQREDVLKIYKEKVLAEKIEQEEYEISIITEFLPKKESDEKIYSYLANITSLANYTSIKDMKMLLADFNATMPGQDPKKVAELAKQILTSI